MSKKGFSAHCEKVAARHQALSKGFTGLASHFTKIAEAHEEDKPQLAKHYAAAAEKCKAMADEHQGLSEAHAGIGEEAERMMNDKTQAELSEKALREKTIRRDGAHGTLPDAPSELRNRPFVNRTGGAPDQRKTVGFDHLTGKVDTSSVDPELADLLNDPAS